MVTLILEGQTYSYSEPDLDWVCTLINGILISEGQTYSYSEPDLDWVCTLINGDSDLGGTD